RLGEGLRLEIETAAPAEETPAARRERERRERQQAAAEAIERDSGVKVLQEVFDARIVPETVHPIE
ncbi:MAG TPA: DNA polymerase III subunit gamma/tau, partial [Gammaproteobacteria bacterium]|nr:DNA polymerase III subunit gamma/tau [Gammaproteobacteria bacterium]